MSVAWGAGCYGELLAVGTFRKRVSVWTVQGGKWIQISWFQGHDAPIRQVAWSDPIFGCQVFACSDDGNFSVLKIVKDEWKGQLIKAHNGTVNCISPQRLPLLVEESCQNLIVTGGSDSLLKVWREGASEESLVGRLFCELDEQPFELAFEFRASSPIQQVLWRKACFGSKSIELLYSCMVTLQLIKDGSLMLLELNTNFSLHVSSKIAQLGDPIATLSESHTGTVLLTTVSGQCHYFTKQKLIPLTLSIT